jgi:Na+-translocating ferredoxin:NAD+ oxidoreductase subunit B
MALHTVRMHTAEEKHIPEATNALAEKIDAWLPQTQCTRCGYPCCRDYASAIAAGKAEINQCPPGGEVTILALAELLDTPPKALDPAFGKYQPRRRAAIDEPRCIGCRKCLDVCPVDAIVGARKQMHTIIEAECNGCELCLPPCPVDCIVLVPVPLDRMLRPWPDYDREEAARWRARSEARQRRLTRQQSARAINKRAHRSPRTSAEGARRESIRAEIRAAVDRVRRKKTGG